MSDCLFCGIAAGKIPSKVVFEDDHVVAFEDINPQAPHHVLVIPRRHIATLDEVPDGETALLGRLVGAATRIARERGVAQSGYRLVWNCQEAAGQSVFHIHLHLLGGRPFGWPPG